jgi:hypothetical protein
MEGRKALRRRGGAGGQLVVLGGSRSSRAVGTGCALHDDVVVYRTGEGIVFSGFSYTFIL